MRWGGGLPILTYTGRCFPKGYLSYSSREAIPRYFLSVYFWYGKVKKNISAVGTSGKNALKWVTLPSFESDLLKTDEDINPQSREILQTLYDGSRAQTCFPLPHHAQRSVDVHNFADYIFARLRRITFIFGNFKPLKLKFIK